MASDSQTVTATEKSLENKVEEEAKSMEKEIVLSETVDVVKDKTESDSNLAITKDEDQASASEPAKESPAVVEEVGAVLKAEEPKEKEKDENSEKVAEPIELKESILVKEGVEEADVEAVLVEKAEDKQTVERVVEEYNKDKMIDVSESTDEGIAKHVEQVDVQSIGDVSAETAENKDVEVLEVEPKSEDSEKVEPHSEKAKELAPVVEVVKAVETPEATEQAKAEIEIEGKLEDKLVETKDDSALSPEKIILTNQESDTDPKKETEGVASSPVDVIEKTISEEKHVVDEPLTVEKASESASALCPTNQDSDADPNKETEADASSPVDVIEKAITEEKHVVDEPSKDEKTEPVSALCPEKVVPTNQDPDTTPKKETEEDASSPADAIEKSITEEKHQVEEPSNNGKENITEAKDVVSKLATEGENIKKDIEPVADGKNKESQKETETESGEKETATEKQEEAITEKVAEVVETEVVAKESDEPKQELEVTTKEVAVKQKHSNSIMSKVKQSLVKAKKAIIGKSPSSKTTSTEEAKGEIKVK